MLFVPLEPLAAKEQNVRISTSATTAVTATIQLQDADDPCIRPTTSCQLSLEENALPTSPCFPLQHSPAEAPPLGQQPLGRQVHSPFRPAGVRIGHPNHVNFSLDALRILTYLPSNSKTLPTPVKVQYLSRWLQSYVQEKAALNKGFIFGFDTGFQGTPKDNNKKHTRHL